MFIYFTVKECDRISLVTYDAKVNLEFELLKMDTVNRERAKSFVKKIRDGSSTNLCGGLIKGTYLYVCMYVIIASMGE